MTTALLTLVGALAVLLVYALCRDSRRRDDAWEKWDALFPEEPLPRGDPHVIELWRRERVP